MAGLQREVMIICGLICLRGWRWGRNSSPLRGSQGNEGRRKGGTKEGRLGLLVRRPDLLMAMCSPMTLWWTRGEYLLVRALRSWPPIRSFITIVLTSNMAVH